MKKKMTRDKGQDEITLKKKITLKGKIVIILQENNNVTRLGLARMLKKDVSLIDTALVSLRKAGYRIFPVNGPGTPLRIAMSEKDAAKFINYRRKLFLPTATRMIANEFEIGQEYRELSGRPRELLLTLNAATKQNAKLSTGANN